MPRLFIAAIVGAVLATPASAANNFYVKDGTAALIAKCSMQQSDRSQADCAVLLDNANQRVNPANAESQATANAALASIATATGRRAIAATSTALMGSVAVGTVKIGPFAPQLDRDIRVILSGTWTGSVAFGTSVDACATIRPLTVGGRPWANFTGNANEVIETPSADSVAYCATATIATGTLAYVVRQ